MLQRTTAQLAPRAAAACGALRTSYTFKRILGTPGASEPILLDLLQAWGEARTRGGDGGALFDAVELVDPLHVQLQRSHSELVVDVRARGSSGSSFLLEVQHHVEPHFPHRAVLCAAADLAAHASDPRAARALRPVHTLAFCDHDFTRSPTGSNNGLGSWRSAVREPRAHVPPDAARGVHAFDLQPRAADMEYLGQGAVNTALAAEMAERLSFIFALLPHAPRLDELTARTPRMLQWASLVAHVRADNVDAVPVEVRRAGVDLLLGRLHESVHETEREEFRAADDLAVLEQAVECAFAEGKAIGRAEAKARAKAEAEGLAEGAAEGMAMGMAVGKAEGVAETLRLLGITTVEAFRHHDCRGLPRSLWRRPAAPARAFYRALGQRGAALRAILVAVRGWRRTSILIRGARRSRD